MQEKRRDLKVAKQKLIIKDVLSTLSKQHPSFYYLSTIEVAAEVKNYMHEAGNLSQTEFAVVQDLKRHDIQILLSLH